MSLFKEMLLLSFPLCAICILIQLNVLWQVTLDDLRSKVENFEILWSSSPNCSKYASYFSFPEFIRFPTVIPGQDAYAYYYPPSNPLFKSDSGETPPLLLKSHGVLYIFVLKILFILTSCFFRLGIFLYYVTYIAAIFSVSFFGILQAVQQLKHVESWIWASSIGQVEGGDS